MVRFDGGKGFANKRGLGRHNRHVQTKFLWVQERIHEKDFKVVKIGTKSNISDIFTKCVTRVLLDKHLHAMGIEFPVDKSKFHKDVV